MNIVLVGNGPSALQKPLGPVIDSFDVVIRTNRYPHGEFVGYVGKRVDWWLANPGPLNLKRIPEELKRVSRIIVINSPYHSHNTSMRSALEEYNAENVEYIPQYYRTASNYRKVYTVSSGCQYLYYLMYATTHIIHVVGCNFLSDSEKGHYYEKHKGGIHLPKHEKSLLLPFVESRRIILL